MTPRENRAGWAGMVCGLGMGLWIAAWIDLPWPFASFWLAYPVGFAGLWLLTMGMRPR